MKIVNKSVKIVRSLSYDNSGTWFCISIKAVQKSDYSTGFSRGVINPRRPISLEKLREDIGGGGGGGQ